MKRSANNLLAVLIIAVLLTTSSCNRISATARTTIVPAATFTATTVPTGRPTATIAPSATTLPPATNLPLATATQPLPTFTPTATKLPPTLTPTATQPPPTNTPSIPHSQMSIISAGDNHTCALTILGGVKCWGDNELGQLGNGTTDDSSTPVDVPGLESGVTAVAAGFMYTCALTAAGGVKCWGYNLYGQLGDGTADNRLTPVDVPGLGSGVVAITAGYAHTCAVTAAGGVKCWGDNMRGQLGDGTKTTRLTPVDVVGLDSGVTAVAAGGDHTCALTTSGGVKCWGWNFRSRLGDGTTTNRLTPVDVSGLGSGVTALAVGWDHTCTLTISGGVKCWGVNNYGQLGDGTTEDSSSPVDVLSLGSGVTAVALGHGHTCALAASGGLKCWGRNENGQLGDGTTDHSPTPMDVVSLGNGIRTVTAGSAHTCALTASGELKCWGYNMYGQLGDGMPLYCSTPVDVVGLGSGTAAVAAGFMHTCALDAAGRVKCWGTNNHGQLGNGTYTSSSTPVDIPSLGSGVAGVTAGWIQTCALTASGGVKCWGGGPLGDGTTDESSTPVDIPGLGSGVTAVVAGDMHTCALTAAGGVKCWGDNESGALGTGSSSTLTPADVLGLDSGVTAVTTMGGHTCALTAAGGVKCWGGTWLGQSGTGRTEDIPTPMDVTSLSSGVVAVAVGGVHTCALTASGGVKCWGGNWLGQLGDGTTENRTTPVDVLNLGSGVAAISAGWDYTCALTASGGVKCWGANLYGQLGDGTTTNRLTPIDVPGLGSGVSRVAAGSQHTCALTAAGGVKCWGDDEYGQLGDGRLLWSAVPVDVAGW